MDTSLGCQLRFSHLDWTSFQESDLPEASVILGSDLVYALDLLPGLCRVLRKLLQRTSGSKAFIACTHRCGDSIDAFKKQLQDEGLRFQVLLKRTFGPEEGILTHHEPFRPISVFKIVFDMVETRH